jgi:uncharacterized damage-inducible protein DinB
LVPLRTAGGAPFEETSGLSITELGDVARRQAQLWREVLSAGLDPDIDVAHTMRAGGRLHGSVGIRVAQALHHGTDHRSQIGTALSSLGVEPPDLDVWVYGELVGKVVEEPLD